MPEHTTDWRELVGRDDIDIVDICTPPGTHAEIAQAAAAAGKAVLCEKPLALTYAEAAAALAAVTARRGPQRGGLQLPAAARGRADAAHDRRRRRRRGPAVAGDLAVR